MATEIKMPALAQTSEEMRLIRWLVEEGQEIERGAPLCEVESDKSVMPLESFEGGIILKKCVAADTLVPVGTTIAIIGKQGETLGIQKQDRRIEPSHDIPTSRASPPERPKNVKATHLVRRLAERKNIDISLVTGSGARGLVTKKDIELYLEAMKDAGKDQLAQHKEIAPAKTGVSESMSTHQRSIAQALVYSKSHIPHYYLKSEIFVDRMLRWREEHQQTGGQKTAFDSLFLYAVARALKRLPRLNGTFDKDTLLIHGEINIGFAVAAGEELVVPVIRNASNKEIRGIDTEVQWLAAKAKNGRIENEDQAHGTFTISNLGMYAVREFAAIINPPQVAILAFGEIHKILHIGVEGAMNVRSAITVTGSFDHRAINGAQAAEFMTLLKKMIEEESW